MPKLRNKLVLLRLMNDFILIHIKFQKREKVNTILKPELT